MTPVITIIISIQAKTKQDWCFKTFLEEWLSHCEEISPHKEFRCLRKKKKFLHFLFLNTSESRSTRWEYNSAADAECLLDLAFLTDVTEELNYLSYKLQGNKKTITDMITAVKTLEAKPGLFEKANASLPLSGEFQDIFIDPVSLESTCHFQGCEYIRDFWTYGRTIYSHSHTSLLHMPQAYGCKRVPNTCRRVMESSALYRHVSVNWPSLIRQSSKIELNRIKNEFTFVIHLGKINWNVLQIIIKMNS